MKYRLICELQSVKASVQPGALWLCVYDYNPYTPKKQLKKHGKSEKGFYKIQLKKSRHSLIIAMVWQWQ